MRSGGGVSDSAGEKQSRASVEEELLGAGAAWLDALYERWRADPAGVPHEWATYFADSGSAGATSHTAMLARMQRTARIAGRGMSAAATAEAERGVQVGEAAQAEHPSRALYLIHAYRVFGHMHARLDPLQLHAVRPSPQLELPYYGLSQADLDTHFPTGDLPGPDTMPLREIVELLQSTYCGHIGPELMHVADSAKKHWLYERLERIRSRPDYGHDVRRQIFEQSMRANEFEHYLHTRYMGQKRFSVEGGESLIPMLHTLIQQAGNRDVKEIILGMAHRGRLNVLANVLGKSLSEIFSEFEGAQFADSEPGAGDVKYHMGFSSDIPTEGGTVHLSLGFNPSHLEIITPVVLGSVRARQCRRGDKGRRQVMGVLIHGDAAFAGQGVVAESLNLGELSGFRTGGTIHVVVNNQIGFTTNPFDARSTLYCTDIAKMVQAPILHVNGDDPEACCLAMQIAMEYKHHFRSDIVIDLLCYRRHGHNEADAPEVTQPVMYRRIQEHDTVEQLYRRRLIDDGILSEEEADEMIRAYREELDRVRREGGSAPSLPNSLHGRWEGYVRFGAEEPETAVDSGRLEELAKLAHSVPDHFTLNSRVEKIYDARIKMMQGQQPADWGCAEAMAYATLVNDGGWVRISGQDSGRGTFFHRHAIVYDEKTGKSFMPLRQLENGDMSHFIAIDSMLSELAVMGFEYGYSIAEPRALVVWEAQYGDFANNAQVVIDQFISAGESKWRRMSGLTLWLPHGYEGQGAEHSSARLERFLQLCAEENMQVVCPTTPAQLFHLLRRQMMINTRKPLIIMGPKSMLRQKLSYSPLAAFTGGRFEPVLAEAEEGIKPAGCRRVVVCSGKVYYDLLAARQEKEINDVAIVRAERLYPFPCEELSRELARYTKAREIVWVQEEPENQGGWYQIRHYLQRCLQDVAKLKHLSRPASAAPAVGSHQRHIEQQQALVDAALAKGEIDG